LLFLSCSIPCLDAQNPGPGARGQITKIDVAEPAFQSRIGGFYPGSEGWRWTAQKFWVMLDSPSRNQTVWCELDFSIPVELLSKTHTVTLTGTANGKPIGKASYSRTGRYNVTWEVPADALKTQPVRIEVSLDKTAQREDGKPLGIIVVTAALVVDEAKNLDQETATALARSGYDRLVALRNAHLSIEKQRELMKLFHDIPIWSEMWFQNVRIEKNPLDLWMVQQMIYELKPELIVETGTWRGGSALYWAYTLNGMGLENSRVITVDIQNVIANAAAHPLWKKYVTFLQGSSVDEKIVSRILAQARGRRTIVMLDSDHRGSHVLKELHAYSPMVTSGMYLIVEDTHIDGVPSQPNFGPGPMSAVETFLKEPAGKDFTQDLRREAFLMTFNPGGWLRRK
jgi:cephalosporin hydroxylase